MKATIKDVAKKAGVSITTVSMVLNNTDNKIKEETKKKVRCAAEELQYVPNRIAKSLVTKKTNLVMLFIPTLSNPFFSTLAKSIGEEFENRGYTLCIYQTLHRELSYQKIADLIESSFVAGALVIDRKVKAFRKELKKYHIVFLDEIDYSDDDSYVVTGDNEKGGFLAVNYLLEKGHRKIALVAGPQDTPNSSRRIAGALDAFMKRDIYFDPSYLFHADYEYQGGIDAAKHLVNKDITAAFCFNDLSAYGFMNQMKEFGKKIPEDYSVIGYDNLFMNEIFRPTLTGIDQRIPEISKVSVTQLLRLIEGRSVKEKRMFITPILVEKDSVKEVEIENT